MQHELSIVTPEAAQSVVRKELGAAVSGHPVEWLTLPFQQGGEEPHWLVKHGHGGSGKTSCVRMFIVARMPDVCDYFDQLAMAMSRGVRPLIVTGWGSGKTQSFVQCLAALSSNVRETPYVAPDPEALRRVVSARVAGVADRLIASARLDGRTLSVWSCEPRLYRVGVDQLPALAGLRDPALKNFSVSASGSWITWPRADVDLDLDAIREVVDAEFRDERERRARGEARRYASAIRTLREKHDLKQAEISGLSEREVRRIESGERMPRFTSLEKLARAHQMSTPKYLSALALLARDTKERSGEARPTRKSS